jgi:Flp pilus assembly protein TadG
MLALLSRCLMRLREDLRGSVLVDFGITAPSLLIILIGTVEFGRFIVDYHAVEKSTRGAARYAARLPLEAIDQEGDWGRTNARKMAWSGSLSGTEGIVPGWTSSSSVTVTVNPRSAGGTEGEVVSVTATVPISFGLLSGLGLPATVDVTFVHEERHVGD